MTFPRQILYNKNILKILISTIFDQKLEKGETFIVNKIKKNLKIKKNFFFKFSSRGRTACFHILKFLIKKNKNKYIIMSPFTIFDLINTVVSSGGTPIFVDSPKNSYGICPLELKKILKKRKVNAVIYTCYNTINSNILEIKKICTQNKVEFILDLAIAPCSTYKGISISSISKYSFMSFSLFKFISIIQGGGVATSDKNLINYINKTENRWKKFKFLDLLGYYFKGVKFLIATNFILFNLIIFKIFKFGDLNNISFIAKHAKNDPNPFISKNYNQKYKKKLTNTQKISIFYQSKKLHHNNQMRKKNYLYLNKNIRNKKILKIHNDNKFLSSYINFPILCNKRNMLSTYLYKNNIDHSKYFYRDCSQISFFKKYSFKSQNNINNLAKNLITLPIYHNINKKYLNKIIKAINKF